MKVSLLLFLSIFTVCYSQEKTLEPRLENIRWITGTWKGEAFGGKTEEIWSKPLWRLYGGYF